MAEIEYVEKVWEAARGNGWAVVGSCRVRGGGNGYVPHGYVLVRRAHCPFPERPYATLRWYSGSSGIGFEQGHYDLTLREGVDDLDERAAP